MIITSFFCSSTTRIPRQQWAPAPGRVDRKFKTFHIFVQGFIVMTAADTKMHWEDQTFLKFLFQNTEPHGFSEAYHGHCTFSRQGKNTKMHKNYYQATKYNNPFIVKCLKVPVESSGLNIKTIAEEKDGKGQDDDLSSWLFHPDISYSFLSSPRNTWRQVIRDRPGAGGETQQPISVQIWANQPITLQEENTDTGLCCSRSQTLEQAAVRRLWSTLTTVEMRN